jgi:SNF2 family DNA or RNA helicase
MPMVILHPEISNKDRGALVRSFSARADENEKYENEEAYKAVVLISNMKLLATGYNIQEANNICIFDLPWTPDQWDQTVGRGYRSGQDREVHVKTLVALGNGIEARIYNAFQMHKEVTDLSFNITNGESEKKEAETKRLRLVKLQRERLERQERERLAKEQGDTEMANA